MRPISPLFLAMIAAVGGFMAWQQPQPSSSNNPNGERFKTRAMSRTRQSLSVFGITKTKWSVAQDRRNARKYRNQLRHKKAQRRSRA